MRYASDSTGRYSPLLFLSSVGAGGLSISFFMYLLWMTPHQGVPVATFDTLMAYLPSAHPVMQAIAIAAIAAIAFFAYVHFRTLVWNIVQYRKWSRTDAYEKLRTSNAETQLLALPLTFAMTINVAFIAGAVFVPGLWTIVEYLFPFAILAFAAVGIYATRIFLDFFTRVLVQGDFDLTKNNSFGQMIPIFAFSMIGVRLHRAGGHVAQPDHLRHCHHAGPVVHRRRLHAGCHEDRSRLRGHARARRGARDGSDALDRHPDHDAGGHWALSHHHGAGPQFRCRGVVRRHIPVPDLAVRHRDRLRRPRPQRHEAFRLFQALRVRRRPIETARWP